MNRGGRQSRVTTCSIAPWRASKVTGLATTTSTPRRLLALGIHEVAEAGEHDDRRVGRQLLDGGGELVAAHLRHRAVGHDEVELARQELVETLDARWWRFPPCGPGCRAARSPLRARGDRLPPRARAADARDRPRDVVRAPARPPLARTGSVTMKVVPWPGSLSSVQRAAVPLRRWRARATGRVRCRAGPWWRRRAPGSAGGPPPSCRCRCRAPRAEPRRPSTWARTADRPALRHRVDRVEDEVRQHLADRGGVAEDDRQRRRPRSRSRIVMPWPERLVLPARLRQRHDLLDAAARGPRPRRQRLSRRSR